MIFFVRLDFYLFRLDNHMRRFSLKRSVITTTLIIMLVTPAFSEVTKLAILPFNVNADKNISFLQKGVTDMLVSRLNRPGAVLVVDGRQQMSSMKVIDGAIDDAKAIDIGRFLGVDQVLFGSITAIGNAISVDTRVLNINEAKPARSFYVLAGSMGEVIPQIDVLSAKINQDLFGLPSQTTAPPVVAKTPVSTYRQHPEKQFSQQRPVAEPSPVTTAPEKTSGTQPFVEPIQVQKGQYWRSQTLTEPINGLAIGDVNGDGKNETILVSNHQLFTYRMDQGRLVKLSETKKDRSRFFIGVDLADINGNGRPEIFITALDINKSRVRSMILESNGQSYDTVERDSSWFYRVATSPGNPPILLGQKPVDEDPYGAAVYQMEWNGRQYEPNRQVVPKKTTNALGCTVGDLLNDGEITSAAFSESDKVMIFNASGQLVASLQDGYGGSLASVNLPVDNKGEPPPLRYLPMRLIIGDANGDGKNELVIAKNKEFTGKHLARLRMFSESQIVGLDWDGAGMAEIWKTRQLSGRLADLTIADLETDGRPDMVAVLVTKEGQLIGTKAKVHLIAYPLEAN